MEEPRAVLHPLEGEAARGAVVLQRLNLQWLQGRGRGGAG